MAAPDRWRRLVTLAVPPAALDPVLFSDYEQLKRFFYLPAEYALAGDNELIPVEGYRSANSGVALAVCPELRCACLTGRP